MAKAGVRALDTVENFLTSATAPDEVIAQMPKRYVSMFLGSGTRPDSDPPYSGRGKQTWLFHLACGGC